MDLVLRPYQLRTLDTAWEALQFKHNVLLVAPCAAGKTILFSKIIQRLLRENAAFRALILTDREILVTQSRDKLAGVAPELAADIGVVCASVTTTKELDRRVTIASRQTLINSLNSFPPVQLVIVDECHLMALPTEDDYEPDQFSAIINKLREYNPNMRLIGCTASPYRLNSGYIFGGENRPGSLPYFDQIDAQITTAELLAGGYIAPLVGRAEANEDFASDLANVGTVAGEFNIGQLSSMMCKVTHVQSCVDAWKKYASDRKKTLVFCCTIEHAEAVAAAFNEAGIKAAAIHSKLSPLDEQIRLAALEHGTMQVFTSVAKLTTGLDVVDLDAGILARPTKSTSLYQQCVGRFQRLAPGKGDALIIDLVGATTDFGTDLDNLRVAVPRWAEGAGEPITKICPGENTDGTVCGKSVHASLFYCPFCGYEFERPEVVEGELTDLKKVEFNKKPEPETYDVAHVDYDIHESKKSGKFLIKVTYACGLNLVFNEWICLKDFYEGYAVAKAEDWWAERTDEDFPASVEEFMFLSGCLAKPLQITVQREGKYNRVVGAVWTLAPIIDDLPPLEPGWRVDPDDCEVPF